jgi:cytoskeletal protein CcmA (bactofilin family)
MGNIHSPSVFIDRGVEFSGTCRMDAVEDATASASASAGAKPTTTAATVAVAKPAGKMSS